MVRFEVLQSQLFCFYAWILKASFLPLCNGFLQLNQDRTELVLNIRALFLLCRTSPPLQPTHLMPKPFLLLLQQQSGKTNLTNRCYEAHNLNVEYFPLHLRWKVRQARTQDVLGQHSYSLAYTSIKKLHSTHLIMTCQKEAAASVKGHRVTQ